MSKVNIVFDMSKYDLFLLCEARFNYRHNLNIGLPGKNQALDRGQLVHAANEIYYQALKDKKPFAEASNMALSKIREVGVISTDLDNDMINRVIDVMEEYYDYWQIADQSFVIEAVEQPFLEELYSDDDVRIFVAGKIDLVFSDNRYQNEPLDHKSYDRSYEVGRMSNQFKCYSYVLKNNYLTVNKIGFQKTLKPHQKFIRTKISFDPLIHEEWKQNVITVLMNKYLTCVAENKWPMNETSCEKFNRRCEFYEICDASGLPAKNYKINANYIKLEPWDVTRAMKKSSQVIEEEKKKREENAEEESPSPAKET